METEIEELFKDDIKESTLRLVHEAKKLTGAVVISVEDTTGAVEQNRASSSG